MEQLDDLDRQIIAALVRNGRASWRLIAEVLGQQERTVARRGNRLLEEGVVSTNAFVNPSGINPGSAFLLRLAAEPRGLRTVADRLADRPDTTWVTALSGSNECVAEVFLPTEGLGRFLYQDLAETGAIQSFTLAPLLDYYRTVSGWKPAVLTEEQYRSLHPAADAGAASLRAASEPARLDETNAALAGLLHLNGRAPVDDLASALSLSKATVSRRLDAMISSGAMFIRAVVDPRTLGFPVESLITISCRGADMDPVGQYLAGLSVTRWAAASDQHLLAQVAVENLSGLQELLSSLRARDDVTDAGSSIYAEVFKRATIRYRNNAPAPELPEEGFLTAAG
jgi:Lrp/AsnC family transcriptional regulator for asnA, asnC and gidA